MMKILNKYEVSKSDIEQIKAIFKKESISVWLKENQLFLTRFKQENSKFIEEINNEESEI